MNQNETSQIVPYTLRTIYIQKSHLRMADNFDPVIPGQPLNGKFRTVGGQITCKELIPENGEGNTIRSCTFVTHFEFRYIRPDEDGAIPQEAEEEAQLVAEISADIAVDYLIGIPEMPSQENLQQWGSGNVLVHAWPYWREYCHAAMSRMNLPVTLMPLLQVKPPTPDKVVEARKLG